MFTGKAKIAMKLSHLKDSMLVSFSIFPWPKQYKAYPFVLAGMYSIIWLNWSF